jgi:hypothetical protein
MRSSSSRTSEYARLIFRAYAWEVPRGSAEATVAVEFNHYFRDFEIANNLRFRTACLTCQRHFLRLRLHFGDVLAMSSASYKLQANPRVNFLLPSLRNMRLI